MKIPYINLGLQWKKERKDLSNIFERILKQGIYVDPDSYEVKSFSFDAGTMNLTYDAIAPAQRSGVVNASENIGLSDEADVLSLTFRHQF